MLLCSVEKKSKYNLLKDIYIYILLTLNNLYNPAILFIPAIFACLLEMSRFYFSSIQDPIQSNPYFILMSNSNFQVGPKTTSLVTQCLCTHLTFFGSSFFVMPNTVDVSRTAELFSTFSNNPVVVCFVGAIILAYIITVIWARRKDLQDKIKV